MNKIAVLDDLFYLNRMAYLCVGGGVWNPFTRLTTSHFHNYILHGEKISLKYAIKTVDNLFSFKNLPILHKLDIQRLDSDMT